MTTGSHPALCWSRALLLAVVVLTVGALAHASAGGLLPGPWAMLSLLVLCTCAAGAFLARQASTVRVVLLVVVGQAAVHTALSALAGHAGEVRRAALPSTLTTANPRTGSFHDHVMPAGQSTPLRVPDWILHLGAELAGPQALMALTHLAAAALVGLWLAAGERALWSLVLLAVRPALPATVRVPVPPRLLVRRTLVLPPVARWLRVLRRRGPPPSFAC